MQFISCIFHFKNPGSRLSIVLTIQSESTLQQLSSSYVIGILFVLASFFLPNNFDFFSFFQGDQLLFSTTAQGGFSICLSKNCDVFQFLLCPLH